MATTSRGWRKVSDNENDKAQAVNDALDDASADITLLANGLSAQIAGIGGGTDGAAVSVVNVPANSEAWTDTGIVLIATDTLIMEATGAISHNSGPDPLYGPKEGVAELRAVVVPDGTTPQGDVAGQSSYRVERFFVGQTGRVWLWIRDVGGKGDNRGSFTVTLTLYRGGMATVIRLLVERSA